MIITLSILLFILSATWAITSGLTEAILYSGKGADAFKWNEHIVFSIQRACFVLMLIICYVIHPLMSLTDFELLLLSCMLSWNLFHDGAYYEGRHLIDCPYYRWYSDSTTSSAKINFTFWERLTLAILGTSLFIYLLIK